MEGDGKGFPDLVLIKNKRIMFVELKSKNGRTSPEQDSWLHELNDVAEVYVWRPADWESGVINRRLK